MAERFSSESMPGKLANTMAELVIQLRLSATIPNFSNVSSNSMPSLVVMARILEGMGSEAPDLLKLGRTIISLANLLTEVPAASGPALNLSLQRLVDFLESFLHGLDQGDDLHTWLNHPRWLSLQRSFINSQTTLAVFDELDDVIGKYQDQHNSVLLSETTREAMAIRWAEVCRQGESAFGINTLAALTGLTMVLLLDSDISRHFLREKLTRGAVDVIIADNPAQAWEICRHQDVSPIVLCDQITPSNHLTGLRKLVEQGAPNIQIPLILVTMGDSSGHFSNLERARNLGASGVWRDPYELAGLLPCILQGKSKN